MNIFIIVLVFGRWNAQRVCFMAFVNANAFLSLTLWDPHVRENPENII